MNDSVVPSSADSRAPDTGTGVILLFGVAGSAARLYDAALSAAGFAALPDGHDAPDAPIRAAVVELNGAQPDFTLIETARRHPAGPLPVVVTTEHGSLNLAVEAMRRGAADVLVRPFAPERLVTAVRAALGAGHDGRSIDPGIAGGVTGGIAAETTIRIDSAPRAGMLDFGGFIGLSPVMQDLYDKIEHVAASAAPVFITGESGTGKEVCAEAIHRHSRRGNKPFIPINCAAIPRDLIESELFGHVKGAFTGAIAEREGAARRADGGTLFLDEIAEMHPDMQTKLLRFLQNQTFMKVGGSKLEQADVRIICATNRDPLAETRIGRFREDLYYRLHVLPLHMPPLRDRGDDVVDIAEVLIRRYNEEEGKNFKGLSDDAASALRSYAWPGNIRQLQNVIRNIIVMHDGDMVGRRMLPAILQQDTVARTAPPGPGARPAAAAPPIRPLAEVERETIENAIAACGGNIPRAAAMLGISPSTIYRKKLGWDDDTGPAARG